MMHKTLMAAAAAAAMPLMAAPTPAAAQHVEGDAHSALMQWARMHAEPGTFWLDSMDDREIIRYTTTRDVSLCLPAPRGVGEADRGYPLRISWDGTNSVVLYPGNCFYFDAKRVVVKPAAELPPNVVLTGRVRAEKALQD